MPTTPSCPLLPDSHFPHASPPYSLLLSTVSPGAAASLQRVEVGKEGTSTSSSQPGVPFTMPWTCRLLPVPRWITPQSRKDERDTVSSTKAQEWRCSPLPSNQCCLVLIPMTLGAPESPLFKKCHFRVSAMSPFFLSSLPQLHHVWG